MENSSPEEENVIQERRNLFRVKRELNCTTTKDIRNLFRLAKETIAIKKRILRDLENLYEPEEEEENHYKLLRVSNLWGNNGFYFSKSNGDRNKTVSLDV